MLQGLGRGESIIACGRAERLALLSPAEAGARPAPWRYGDERTGQLDMENRGDGGAEKGD